MKKLYSTTDHVVLELIKTRLKEEHIEYLVKNEFPPAAGEIVPAVAWPEIWILDEQDYPKARRVLEEERQDQSAELGSWQCSQCGEWLEGQFKVCWNCGNQRRT